MIKRKEGINLSKSARLWTGRYVAIVLMAFLFFVCVQLLTAGFPAYITDVKNNPAQGGLMTTVFMLAAIVTRPLIGYLIHKINMKVMSLAGLVFVAVTIGSTGLGLLASYTGYHFIYGFSILFLVVLLLLYTFVFIKGESRSHIVEEG